MERLQTCLLLLTAGVVCMASQSQVLTKKVGVDKIDDVKNELVIHAEDSNKRNKELLDTVKTMQRENKENVNLLEKSIGGVQKILEALQLELNEITSLSSANNKSRKGRNMDIEKKDVDCSHFQRMHREHPLKILKTGIYRASPYPTNHESAKSNCEGLGMRLAIVDSKATSLALTSYLRKVSLSLWVADIYHGDVVGQYKWADGRLVDTSFIRGISQSIIKGSCVSLEVARGVFVSRPCSVKRFALCETDSLYASCFSNI